MENITGNKMENITITNILSSLHLGNRYHTSNNAILFPSKWNTLCCATIDQSKQVSFIDSREPEYRSLT